MRNGEENLIRGKAGDSHSFSPLWQPPFVTKLAAEDRCHLNGLAMESGKPRYVTAVSQSDVADGWQRGDRHRSLDAALAASS